MAGGVLVGWSSPSAGASGTESWLSRVNDIREASGLSPVTANNAWVQGMDNHLTYLAKTPASYRTGQYQSVHTENPQSPYYTSSGAQEAGHSDIASGTSSDLQAINAWLSAPFHAIGMLRPALQQVAFARDSSGEAMLDVISGVNQNATPNSQPVLFPGAGSTINLSRFGGESPSPVETCNHVHPGADYSDAGLPLIALLTQAPTSDLSVTLTRPDGSTVSSSSPDLCMVDENDYTSSDSVYGPTGAQILSSDNAVLVIPRTQLTNGTYSVDITQGGQSDITWSFTSDIAAQPPQVEYGVQCSASNGRTGAVFIAVANYDEGAGPARYTVSYDGVSRQTSTVADGGTAQVVLPGVPSGSGTVDVTGSDGSSTTQAVTVGRCPAYEVVRVGYAATNSVHTLTLKLDNRLNSAKTHFLVKGKGVRKHTFSVAGGHRSNAKVHLTRRHVRMKVLVSGHTVARAQFNL